jgi:hypothetical protein
MSDDQCNMSCLAFEGRLNPASIISTAAGRMENSVGDSANGTRVSRFTSAQVSANGLDIICHGHLESGHPEQRDKFAKLVKACPTSLSYKDGQWDNSLVT